MQIDQFGAVYTIVKIKNGIITEIFSKYIIYEVVRDTHQHFVVGGIKSRERGFCGTTQIQGRSPPRIKMRLIIPTSHLRVTSVILGLSSLFSCGYYITPGLLHRVT